MPRPPARPRRPSCRRRYPNPGTGATPPPRVVQYVLVPTACRRPSASAVGCPYVIRHADRHDADLRRRGVQPGRIRAVAAAVMMDLVDFDPPNACATDVSMSAYDGIEIVSGDDADPRAWHERADTAATARCHSIAEHARTDPASYAAVVEHVPDRFCDMEYAPSLQTAVALAGAPGGRAHVFPPAAGWRRRWWWRRRVARIRIDRAPVFAPLKSPPKTASKCPNRTSATRLLSFSSVVAIPFAFDATKRIVTGCRRTRRRA